MLAYLCCNLNLFLVGNFSNQRFHIDREKPHFDLLSTHIYIRDYNTSFVNRPRQLVAIFCFELNYGYQLTRSIDETSIVVVYLNVC